MSNLHASQEGTYEVLVSNRDGSIDSARAVVLLDNPLEIRYSPTAACRYNLRLERPGRTHSPSPGLEQSGDLERSFYQCRAHRHR